MTTIVPGDRVHHWMIIAINGRRVTARCRCHQIRIVAVEDLLSGVRTSCRCAPPAPEHRQALNEAQAQRQRLRNFNWRLERGR